MSKRRWLLGMVLGCLGLILVLGPALAAERPIRLGVLFIMSGPMGGYGKHGTQAVQLALDEINGQGGILGRKVEAIFEDDKMQVDRGVQVVKKFIDQDNVDFIIGPTSSAIALALAEVVQQSNKILVLTQSATNSLTDAKFNPYLFSTLSNAMMHSRAGAYFLADKPYKRWMNIGPDYAYGRESWNSFITKLKELRPEVEVVGELWPKLMETGLRLGSPGCVHPDNDWMKEFMKKADERKLQVDFVAVHDYGGPNPQTLVNKLKRVYEMYGRPVWITEFGVGDWQAKSVQEHRHGPEKVLEFMQGVLPELDKLNFVEKYAWVPAQKDNKHLGTSALFHEDGTLTALGRFYANYNSVF